VIILAATVHWSPDGMIGGKVFLMGIGGGCGGKHGEMHDEWFEAALLLCTYRK